MALGQGTDGSEDVNDFLTRIRELGEKRDKEDEERTRKLEEEILQGRREREARRAERARSISPTKDSPLISDSPAQRESALASPTSPQSIIPPVDLFPTTKTLDLNLASRELTPSELDIDTEAKSVDGSRGDTENSPMPSGQFRAMSWTQRPQSRDIESLPSTLKFPSDLPNIGPKETDTKTSANDSDTTISRAEIAQTLGTKDPSWFKQTSDRGIGSLACRRALNTPSSDMQLREGSFKLPGLSKEPAVDPDKGSSYDGSERSRSPSRASSVYGTSSFGNRYSSISSVSTTGGLGSPVPLSSVHRLEGRLPLNTGDSQQVDRVTMSPSQSRLASDRPSSPTKGLGGFVQSAMMKRSDSVSKRWSAQSGSNSFRNSFISTRGERPPSRTGLQSPKGQVISTTQEPGSRPGSSHSEATVIRHSDSKNPNPENESLKEGVTPGNSVAKSSFPSHSASASDSISTPDGLPITLSKTMDPKRWSPSKASWLESALNKPESLRPKSAKSPEEPEWKKGLPNKLRVSGDLTQNDKKSEDPLALPTTGESICNSDSDLLQASKEAVPSRNPQGTPGKTGSGFSAAALSPVDNHEKTHVAQSPAIPPKNQNLDIKVRGASKGNGLTASDSEIPSSDFNEKSTPNLPASKATPQKPQTNDFRANLRRREIPDEKSNSGEPEFKSVFGRLRRTETKNYVAPNELKENILKGKAALNVTGGPKKTARIDEFKESILKQKEAMKAGGGSTRRATNDERNLPGLSSSSVPEAIAKRNALNRSDSVRSNISNTSSTVVIPKPFQPKAVSLHTRSESIEAPLESGRSSPIKKLEEAQEHTVSRTSSAHSISPKILDGISATDNSRPNSSSGLPTTHLDRESGKGKLANRLNPALAGILARGLPPEAKTPFRGVTPVPSMDAPQNCSPAPLTHMTKSRAKGPKRRLPRKGEAKEESRQSSPRTDTPSASNIKNDHHYSDTSPTKDDSSFVERLESSNVSKPRQAAMAADPVGLRNSSPKTSDIHSNKLSTENAVDSRLEFLPSLTYSEPKEPIKPPSKPANLSINTEPKDKTSPAANFTSLPSKSSQSPVVQKKISSALLARNKSPAFLVEQASHSNTSPREKNMQTLSTDLKAQLSQENIVSPVSKRVVSPPVPPKPPAVNTVQSSDQRLASPVSPFPQTLDAAQIFTNFFGVPPSAKSKVDIDPLAILSSIPEPVPKTNTLRKQIWEFSNDGKRKDLPPNQEYILFEESMYLCIHTFKVASGSKTTQTHLWCGDGVSEAIIEDAQLFARKLARENNSKLEILRQGKETASFIQALGGIILTRRGSSSRATSSASYMLCGRRHLGQIAFDEVDITPQSLCSGYPYIISAGSGCLYLWKGRGSTADELGCARLIGMDLGLTGEIEEVTEGQEPSCFFDCFPNSGDVRTYHSADYWNFKPNNEKYGCRLFRIDHGLGQGFGAAFWNRRGTHSPGARPGDTVQEIEPFCQRDLDPEHIYVLDAFFEIYVIVGEQARSRSAEFASALVFAQEYGFLAVSEQDRPFLPKSHVVLNGLTDECKKVFRKWDDRLGGFSNDKPVQLLSLNDAIDTIR
ncbi:hypothetical protein PRK78_000262 [Emydomyces testavorans]|uniref:Gelsolin repeat protein n=1 Tax=Emydomyces testavorans TaxID=2070801 RepID=A0AAF0IFN3_9EURO|nr:hypothetical protein PRK78_000262 [Emydomyces testavorans]